MKFSKDSASGCGNGWSFGNCERIIDPVEPNPVELAVPVVVEVEGLAVAAAAPPSVFVPPRFPVKPVLAGVVVEPNVPRPPNVLVPPEK